MKKQIVATIVLIIASYISFSQKSKVDSLLIIANSNLHDTIRIQTFLNIGDTYEYSVPDSALHYYQKAKEIAEKNLGKHRTYSKLYSTASRYMGIVFLSRGNFNTAKNYFNKSIEASKTINDKLAIASGYMNIGVCHVKQGNYDSALYFYQQTQDIAIQLNDTPTLSKCYGNIGEVWWNKGVYDKATEYYLMQLSIAEKYNNIQGMYMCYNNLGSIYSTQLEYDKSIEYFLKAIQIIEVYGDKKSLSAAYNNIGIIYYEKGDPSKAIEYYTKALKISEAIDDKQGASICLGSIGIVYYGEKNYDNAIEYYKKQLKIAEEIGDKNTAATALGNTSGSYIALADSFKLDKNKKISYLKQAIEFGNKAYSISNEIGNLQSINNNSKELVKAYKAIGDYKKSLEFAEIYISTRDSMFREEKTKAITEMQTKYETEKKQQEIEKQQLVIEKQEIENRRQRNIRNFFIAGSLLLALLALAILRGYQVKKRSNTIITEKNALLEQANEEIAAQRDLVTEQRDHIETIHEELTSSIRYAKRIQGAVLPSAEQMTELLGDHFVLFKPKDIVSGDFYWATKVKQFLIFCVADCTGHGVPGAFMSMLGVSFLNDIVHKENVTSASEVLNHLRTSIIGALKQRGDGSEQKDGMDMGLCVINTETLHMQFAGGYNPCWIIPNPEFPSPRIQGENEEEESEIIQLKPDKMPIAIHKHMESYSNHEVQLFPGDQIYLMSDGFQDQFGGPQGKKFMVKNLRELVVANASLPLDQQREALESTLENWKNGAEQVDDVTIMGIRV